MKTAIAAMLLAIAIVSPSSAQQRPVTRQGDLLLYKIQALRDRLAIQCQRLPSNFERNDCGRSVFTSYYSIQDSIRNAERLGDDGNVLRLISQKVDAFTVENDPLLQKLERTVVTVK